MFSRDANRKPEIVATENWFYFFGNRLSIYLFHFRQRNYIKITMSNKINSHVCLMLSVYKSFHQTVKYSRLASLCILLIKRLYANYTNALYILAK